MIEEVILVNTEDHPIGIMEKLEAHKRGLLHRAFSIFIFNTKGELLLQRRAYDKYHSGGLWTNTCCSHPRPHEELVEAARRRLWEEMGLDCELIPVFSYIYNIQFPNGLYEHELDHVLIGWTDSLPNVHKGEVAEYTFMSFDDVYMDIAKRSSHYTEWFKILVEEIYSDLKPMEKR